MVKESGLVDDGTADIISGVADAAERVADAAVNQAEAMGGSCISYMHH